VVFQFNLFFDDFILVPFSSLYSAVVPDPVAKGVKNLLNFTASPISMVSYLMTGQGEKAALTLMRSVVNLVFGFCGLVDVATEMGLLVDPKTIGQGLGSLGVGTGPYLMLPFLGPTNPRDFVGDFLEALYNPVGICVAPNAQRAFYLSRQGTYMISTRAGVLDVESDIRAQSADYYETFRCMYWQKAGKTTAEEDTPVPVRKDR
jgi:phospholipid-binding lipoprotein MlaA